MLAAATMHKLLAALAGCVAAAEGFHSSRVLSQVVWLTDMVLPCCAWPDLLNPADNAIRLWAFRPRALSSDRQPGRQVCDRTRLLACQPLLYVVLPGCGSVLQQLCQLSCAEQLPGLVKGLWPHNGVELNVLQHLQANSTIQCMSISHILTL